MHAFFAYLFDELVHDLIWLHACKVLKVVTRWWQKQKTMLKRWIQRRLRLRLQSQGAGVTKKKNWFKTIGEEEKQREKEKFRLKRFCWNKANACMYMHLQQCSRALRGINTHCHTCDMHAQNEVTKCVRLIYNQRCCCVICVVVFYRPPRPTFFQHAFAF